MSSRRRRAIPPAGSASTRRGPRARVGRLLVFLFVLLGAAAILVGPRAYRYSVDYDRQVYQPSSAGPGAPTYYYLDWRADWADPRELGPAVVFGPILTPRAVRVPRGSVGWPPSAGGPREEHSGDYLTEDATESLVAPSTGESEWLYDPIGLIQAGLSLHDQILDGSAAGSPGSQMADHAGDPDLDRRKILLDQVDWLHRSAEWLPDSIAVWSVPWIAGRYGLRPPWISALSQGQAISLLARTSAWDRPQDLVLARAVVRSLLDSTLPIVLRDESGIRFFEEFPAQPPTEVLNGCLFAWLGLWDYTRVTGDAPLRRTCLDLLDRIEEQVPEYELEGLGLEGWTRYDGRGERPTSPVYQELHAALAEAISAETGRSFWRVRAERWRESAESPWRRLWVFVLVARHKTASLSLLE